MFRVGEIIAAQLPSGIEHYGNFTERGTVISSSKRLGCVAEETMQDFSSGHPVVSKGYPSNLPGSIVVSTARKLIGKKWKLFTDNCQHFATGNHGKRHSPQLQLAVVCIAVVATVVLINRGKVLQV